MLESVEKGNFQYRKLEESEQKARGILGRLVGKCADFINPTRNGRKYSEKLWDNVFDSPLMKEKIANRCCFGELNHPANRTETDMEKIAICLAEQPKKGKDGKLYGVFDILSTPNGRILKALCDYGCIVGISSRGQGDLITDDDGEEAVDPDTYECECFDVVIMPGVEDARLKYVSEGLDKNSVRLKKALQESFNKANDGEKKIMQETLKNLKINIYESTEEEKKESEESEINDSEQEDIKKKEDSDTKKTSDQEKNSDEKDDTSDSDIADKSETQETDIELDYQNLNDMSDADLVSFDDEENLTSKDDRSDADIFLDFLANNFDDDSIRKVCKILDIEIVDDNKEESEEDEIKTSDDDNEKIDSDAEPKKDSDEDKKDTDSKKADKKEDEANNVGSSDLVNSLKEALKSKSDLENMVKSLQKKLAVSDAKVNEKLEECNRYKESISRLSIIAKNSKDLKQKALKLEECLKEKDAFASSQNAKISKLMKSSENSKTLTESLTGKISEINSLTEEIMQQKDQIALLKESMSKESKRLTEKLQKEKQLTDSYKAFATKAVNKYISVKSDILGLNEKDIKRRLGEKYTLTDVDQVCEDLKSYQLNVSRLPFSIDKKVNVKMNQNLNSQTLSNSSSDDDVDDLLFKLANKTF